MTTPKEKEIYKAIIDFQKKYNRIPGVEEVLAITRGNKYHTIRLLKKMGFHQPDELLAPEEKKVLSIYKPGMNHDEIAKRTNIPRLEVGQIVKNLRRKGFEVESLAEIKKRENKIAYIKVTDGPYQGWRGYVTAYFSSYDKCKLFRNGKETEVTIDHLDYKNI